MTADIKTRILHWWQEGKGPSMVSWVVSIAVIILFIEGLSWLGGHLVQRNRDWVDNLFAESEHARQAFVEDTVRQLRLDGCRLVAIDVKRQGTFVCRDLTRQEIADVTVAWRSATEGETP